MLITKDEIVCPTGKPGAQSIIIDLRPISKVEVRIDEIQALTKEKAPELLSQFIIAWKELHQNMVLLTKELNDAKRHSDRVRGRLILDEIPKQLEVKGLATSRSPAGSADLREAMLTQNEEYQETLTRIDYLTAVIELLDGKLTAFDMAFTSIKKVIGDISPSMYNKPEPGTRY